MEKERTLPELLEKHTLMAENELAFRHKYLGIWNGVTWGEYYSRVQELAITLSNDYRVNYGETVAIIGENTPQWLYSQLATQALGGISVGINPEVLSHQLIYYLQDCQARIVIVEDQEQVDKLLEIESEIPFVESIIYYNNQGMRHYQDSKLTYFEDLFDRGKAFLKVEKTFLQDKISQLKENDTAIIAFSGGTTGDAKGVRLSHHQLITAASNLNSVDPINEKDDYFSFLSLAWIYEQIMSITFPLLKGMVVNFPEKPNTVLTDLQEIGPHTFLAYPRVFETFISNLRNRLERSSKFKKKMYYFFQKYGARVANAKLNKGPISFFDQWMYYLGDWLFFNAIRDHIGFSRVRHAYIAGGALSSKSLLFFHSIGINVKQTYGGTELAGIVSVHRDGDVRDGTAGYPLPDIEVKISENEIYVKSPSISSQDEIWVSLGDVGNIDDDGHLHIVDRKEDVFSLTNGEVIYPTKIEDVLKTSPYIQEAVCFGENRPYVTAIINIDVNSVGEWADQSQIGYTSYYELTNNKEVLQLIEKEVRGLMESIPQPTQVIKFVILHKPLTAKEEELTWTLRVRRNFLKKEYDSIINGMYSNKLEVKVHEHNVFKANDEINLRIIQFAIAKEVS